jgi:hypothetical protein
MSDTLDDIDNVNIIFKQRCTGRRFKRSLPTVKQSLTVEEYETKLNPSRETEGLGPVSAKTSGEFCYNTPITSCQIYSSESTRKRTRQWLLWTQMSPRL